MAENLIPIKKVKVAGQIIYPATVLDAIKDAKSVKVEGVEQNANYGKTLREILESQESGIKSAIKGDATENGETLGKLEDRVETLETALKIGETDGAKIDQIDEVLDWFADVEETDPTGAAVITAVSAVGKAAVPALGTEGEDGYVPALEATGLLKRVADLEAQESTKVEASETNGNIKVDGEEVTVYTEAENTVHDADYAHITVTESSVSDGTTTFSKYEHPEGTLADTAFVKVGSDALGHVVIGDAVSQEDVLGLIGEDVYDEAGAAADVLGTEADVAGTKTVYGLAAEIGTKAQAAEYYTTYEEYVAAAEAEGWAPDYTLKREFDDDAPDAGEKVKSEAKAATGLYKEIEDAVSAIAHTTVEASETNGNIKVNGEEVTVFTPGAESDVTVATASANYASATGHEISISTTAIANEATGLATAQGVYDYALTAVATTDTTEYDDVF